MKWEYITDLENHNLSEENLIKIKKKIKISSIRMLILFSLILLISLVGIPRIIIFIRIVNSNSHIFQIVGISLYAIALLLVVLYYLGIVIYYYRHIDDEELVYNIYKVRKKYDLISFTCKCLSIFLFFLIFILNPCTVSGASMNDTFLNNDKVICTDILYYPKKNDVVVFDSSKYGGNALFIKRVVAIENDEISYVDGEFYVNGEKEEIQRMNFINYYGIINGINKIDKTLVNGTTAIIPKGMAVVLGDNRENSHDSGEFGPIYINDIYGKVILRVFPFNKIRFF